MISNATRAELQRLTNVVLKLQEHIDALEKADDAKDFAVLEKQVDFLAREVQYLNDHCL